MARRSPLVLLLLILYALAHAVPRNVLFIGCDDLNTHLAPWAYEPILTPTVDQLAEVGMRFDRTFCQYPVYGSSRASFLSGLYSESTGVLSNTVDIREERPGTLTLPQFFKENGYWTAGVGKIFHNPKTDPVDPAWDENIRFLNDELPVVTAARQKFEAEFGPDTTSANRKRWREIEKQAKSKLDAQTPPGYGRSGLTDSNTKTARMFARLRTGWRPTRRGINSSSSP